MFWYRRSGPTRTEDEVPERAVQFAQVLLSKHEQIEKPGTFTMLEREWDLLPGVFAPIFTGASSLFARWVPYPKGGSFLEVGSGTGLIAVSAALAGCDPVVAVDITEEAVRNTASNARRHGVADRVRALVSDLYDGLPGQRFDMIFWNSNFVEVPATYTYATPLEQAVFDPDYATHRRYLAQASQHLTARGRLLLGFSSMGRLARLQDVAAELGRDVVVLTNEVRDVPHRVEYQLLELVEAGRLT
jgi:release factor glutamine methyltransferase